MFANIVANKKHWIQQGSFRVLILSLLVTVMCVPFITTWASPESVEGLDFQTSRKQTSHSLWKHVLAAGIVLSYLIKN